LNYGIPSASSLASRPGWPRTPDALLASGSHVGDGNVACETTGNGLFKGPDTSNLCLPTTSDLCSGRPSQISRPDVPLILFDGKGHAARKTRFLLPKNDEGPIGQLPSHHPPELVSLIEKKEKSKVSLAEWMSIEQNIPCDGQALPNFNLIPVQRTYSQGKVLPRDRGLLFHAALKPHFQSKYRTGHLLVGSRSHRLLGLVSTSIFFWDARTTCHQTRHARPGTTRDSIDRIPEGRECLEYDKNPQLPTTWD